MYMMYLILYYIINKIIFKTQVHYSMIGQYDVVVCVC